MGDILDDIEKILKALDKYCDLNDCSKDECECVFANSEGSCVFKTTNDIHDFTDLIDMLRKQEEK